MRGIVICGKEVLGPDAVDNYVLIGKLEMGADGKTLTQTSIPRLINATGKEGLPGLPLGRIRYAP
jgi:hypothetical protein